MLIFSPGRQTNNPGGDPRPDPWQKGSGSDEDGLPLLSQRIADTSPPLMNAVTQ
jgi:hypothetical protein